MNITLVSNFSEWTKNELPDLTKWFSPKVELNWKVINTQYSIIPWVTLPPNDIEQNRGITEAYKVDPDWYEKNVTLLDPTCDIIIFHIPMNQWKNTQIRGERNGHPMGPVEITICAEEGKQASFQGELTSEFFYFARHEILHALYMISGQEDHVHTKTAQECLNELVISNTLGVENKINAILKAIALLKDQLARLGQPSQGKIETWARAIQKHEGWILPGTPGYPLGSLSFRNKNPGNLRPIGWKKQIGQYGGFATFATYQDGFDTLVTMLSNAARGLSKIYSPNDTLYTFYSKYCPDGTDKIYAEYIGRELNVSPYTQIKNLI